MSKGMFGSAFDFNRDGKLSFSERCMEYAYLNDQMKKGQKKSAPASKRTGKKTGTKGLF